MVETMDLGIGAKISLDLTSQFLCLPDLEMVHFFTCCIACPFILGMPN